MTKASALAIVYALFLHKNSENEVHSSLNRLILFRLVITKLSAYSRIQAIFNRQDG